MQAHVGHARATCLDPNARVDSKIKNRKEEVCAPALFVTSSPPTLNVCCRQDGRTPCCFGILIGGFSLETLRTV